MKRTHRCLLALLCASLLAGCAGTPPREAQPPIVFVHGNGDTAALWYPTVWRYESNGWPRERLFAVDLPYPLARTDVAPEASVVLDGRIAGFRANDQTNLPLEGAAIEIFETSAQTGERLGVGRDAMSLDGKPPPGLPAGVPGIAASKLKLNEAAVRSVAAVFNNQRIVARSWPLKENRVVFAEFHD